MSNDIVRTAIQGRLKAWADAQLPVLPVVWENTEYTPVQGTAYLRGFLMPAETKNPSQGGLHKVYNGLYQISVFFGKGVGTGPVEAACNGIEVLFKAGTTIEKSDRLINILRTPAVAKGAPDGAGFYMVPVTIWYEMEDFT